MGDEKGSGSSPLGTLAHLVLACVSGDGLRGRSFNRSYVNPGMHYNYFIHGVIGLLNSQRDNLKINVAAAYGASFTISKCLALPCLMADLYRYDKFLCALHLGSGLIPLAIMLGGEKNDDLANFSVTVNLISLCYYSYKNDSTYGWYTAAAALFAYFMAPTLGEGVYPLGLALVDHCAHKISFGSINL